MNAAELLEVPERDAPAYTLVDWLELACLINDPHAIAFAELVNALDLDTDRDPSDPAEIDEFREQRFGDIGQEISYRTAALENSYPFVLSSDSLKLCLATDLHAAHHSYLFSLVLSHAVGSELVPKKIGPSEDELREARDLFQVCSTAAAAGHTGGPSFSIGWPRTDIKPFHKKLKYCWTFFGDGGIVDIPPESVPDHVKDDGLDVLSFWIEKDGGPSHGYLIGQVASGNNWKAKSAKPVIELLKSDWFSPNPAAPAHAVTFIPFYVPAGEARRPSILHGYVMGRLRLPKHVYGAFELSKNGTKPIERMDEFARVAAWIDRRIGLIRKTPQ